jgi:hypothetical protein
MLTASGFDELTTLTGNLYADFEDEVIADIARRLVKAGIVEVTATAAWQMQRLNESGSLYENIIERLSKLTRESEPALRKMFYEAGVRSMKFDDSIYARVGLNPLPLNLSPAMANVLAAGFRKTAGKLLNLTMTTASAGQVAFEHALDMAYLEVTSGTMSYGQAIRAQIKELAKEGIKIIDYPTGHKDKVDVAVRRALLTGVAQTTAELQLARLAEMGVELIQTSAHIGARPTHEVWQGKIFSLKPNSKYPDFFTETGFGTVTGLSGINCRHSFYPYFEGISENAYEQATLDEYADKRVAYNGKEMSVYEGMQVQRSIERDIRKVKRTAGALGEAGLDNTEELFEVHRLQAKMRDFINQTGLQRQGEREGGRVLKNAVVPVKKTYRKFNDTDEKFMSAEAEKQIKEFGDLITVGPGASKYSYSGDEVRAIKNYKIDSNQINEYLRTGKIKGRLTDPGTNLTINQKMLDSWIFNLDSAISKSTVPEDIMTFRGLSKKSIGPDTGSYVGTVFLDRAFSSTTLNERSALGWSWMHGEVDGIVVAIKLDAGSKALYAEWFNDRGEYELLLPRGTKFKVLKDELTDRYISADQQLEKWRLLTVEVINESD